MGIIQEGSRGPKAHIQGRLNWINETDQPYLQIIEGLERLHPEWDGKTLILKGILALKELEGIEITGPVSDDAELINQKIGAMNKKLDQIVNIINSLAANGFTAPPEVIREFESVSNEISVLSTASQFGSDLVIADDDEDDD